MCLSPGYLSVFVVEALDMALVLTTSSQGNTPSQQRRTYAAFDLGRTS